MAQLQLGYHVPHVPVEEWAEEADRRRVSWPRDWRQPFLGRGIQMRAHWRYERRLTWRQRQMMARRRLKVSRPERRWAHEGREEALSLCEENVHQA